MQREQAENRQKTIGGFCLLVFLCGSILRTRSSTMQHDASILPRFASGFDGLSELVRTCFSTS
jgi:hypothetical protein